jgi:trigger factor
MKKIALILAIVLAFSCVMISCKKEVDVNDPATSIRDLWEVPYQYDLSKYIDISEEDYIGVSYTKADINVTDADVQREIQKLLDEHSTKIEITDRAAEEGDYVNVDYTGYMDGELMENGSNKGDEFQIGNASFIPGFQEGIVGHKVGETFTVDATFPEDYGVEELNGKTAQFEMVLNSVYTLEYPTVDDAFIAENTEYETLLDYYSATQEELVKKAESSAVVTQKNEAFAKIYENVEILDYPEAEYQMYYQQFVNQYYAIAESYGQDFETFITQTANSSVEEFKSYAEQYAKSTVDMEMIFFAIANKVGVIDALTKKQYDEYLINIAAEYLTTPEEFLKNYGEESIWRSLVWDTVMDYVLENGVETAPVVNNGTPVETPKSETETVDTAETPVEEQ